MNLPIPPSLRECTLLITRSVQLGQLSSEMKL